MILFICFLHYFISYDNVSYAMIQKCIKFCCFIYNIILFQIWYFFIQKNIIWYNILTYTMISMLNRTIIYHLLHNCDVLCDVICIIWYSKILCNDMVLWDKIKFITWYNVISYFMIKKNYICLYNVICDNIILFHNILQYYIVS